MKVAAANLLEISTTPQVLREHEQLTRIRLRLAQNQPQAAESPLEELKPSDVPALAAHLN